MELSKTPEVFETKNPEASGYKEIKPETGITPEESVNFWKEEIFGGTLDGFSDAETEKDVDHYTTREERIGCTPVKGVEWLGERGDSECIPTDETEKGMSVREKLAEYGEQGILYKDGDADFSKVSKESVEIENMTENRAQNFNKAYEASAQKWNNENRDGRNDWTPREVKEWVKANKLTPHECSDMKTIQFVDKYIHEFFKHSGGVAECKKKMEGE